MTTASRRWRRAGRWLDPTLASVLLVGCEVEAVVALRAHHSHHNWPLAANVVVIALMTVPLAWRRAVPLASASIVIVSVVVLVGVGLSGIHNVNSPQLLLFIAPYSLAAYSVRSRAVLGLAICVAALGVLAALTSARPGSLIFTMGACTGSWAAGRLLRARRAQTDELEYLTSRIAAEREGRELLAITEQRTRIARELQALVASSVSAMIVQTQAAQRLLNQDPGQADAAMATIEDTGRQALGEMRRILGVLRHPAEPPDLTPQPGVGQIAALVEQERRSRRPVTLQVEGDPGPLPASVDLAVYRILAETVESVADHTSPIGILVRFGADAVELIVTVDGTVSAAWPSVAVCERVTLCQGAVDVDSHAGSGARLTVRLPRVVEGALV